MPPPMWYATPPWSRRLASRVLVLTPGEGDAHAVNSVLVEAGFNPHVCADIAEVAAELGLEQHMGAAAVILTQEAFNFFVPTGANHQLMDALANQPAWSDLPLIVLASASAGGPDAWAIARALDPLGNITVLERPLRRATLLNAVSVALRARGRQYDLRTILDELARHREHLSELVTQKTAQLAASTASLNASERLASLGTLAAGLGHDIANLTLPIRARLDLLRASVVGDEAHEDLAAIGVALTHLSRLSAGMRLMGMDPARETASAPAMELSAWAAETEPMLRASLPRHVQLVCEVPEGLGVPVARHRLAQAVFNLVQNAGEAMAGQEQGTVRLSAEAAATEKGEPLVRIRVSDDGPGMSPEVLARCFEPYFSTKGRAIATGMGLGMVRGIVEAAGGKVEVCSSPGKGTTFTLTLPAVVGAATAAGGGVGR